MHPTKALAMTVQAEHWESDNWTLQEGNEHEELTLLSGQLTLFTYRNLSISLYSTKQKPWDFENGSPRQEGRNEGNGIKKLKSTSPLAHNFYYYITPAFDDFSLSAWKLEINHSQDTFCSPNNSEIRNRPRSVKWRDNGVTEAPSALWMIQRAFHFPYALGTASSCTRTSPNVAFNQKRKEQQWRNQ